MEPHTKEFLKALLCAILAVATSWTVVGGIVFGLAMIYYLVQGLTEKHGERPWWTKSFLTLWRERKAEQND